MKSILKTVIFILIVTPIFSQKIIKKNGVTIVIAEKDTTTKNTKIITDTIKNDDQIKLTCNKSYSRNFNTTYSTSISYNRALEFINKNYYNPEYVIKGSLKDKSITFSGKTEIHREITLMYTYFWYIKYNIQLNFSDKNCLITVELQDIIYKSDSYIKYHSFPSYIYNDKCCPKKLTEFFINPIQNWINNVYQNLNSELNNKDLTSEEAISRVKEIKELRDLEIISKEEFESERSVLIKFIKR